MSGSLPFLLCMSADTTLVPYSQSTLDSLENICRTARHIFYSSPDGISFLVFCITIIAVVTGIAAAVFAFLTFRAERNYHTALKDARDNLKETEEIKQKVEEIKREAEEIKKEVEALVNESKVAIKITQERGRCLSRIAKEQSEALTPHVTTFADTLLASAEQLKLPMEMKKFVKTMTDGIMLYGSYSAEATRLFVAEGEAFDAAVKFFRMRGAASEEIVGHTINLLERRLKIEKEKSPPEQDIEVAEKLTQAITELKAQEESFKLQRTEAERRKGTKKSRKKKR
ncbi:hypothetical protein CEE36_11020 [candidate division TA06 bacterium B3_TA06]|uniref:Uncharacterized protein n=1 Tax=candidate division TA06 bacterium B3_TA06 TaxID=2012487 RepID=A0A532URS3_UNCT6|nr:MAG: hypothetical protein CEE36_11020 [candidate division TA06 bacterium B3_TA06]